MNKTITSVLIFFVLFSFSDIAFPQNKLVDLIVNEWRLVSIIDSAGDAFKQTGKDILLISDNNYNNSFALYEGSLYGYGNWSVVDSILILAYNSKPMDNEVDSSVYTTINNEPVLILYSDGEEVSRVKTDGEASAKTRYLNIIECTGSILILSDVEYKFVYYSTGKFDIVPETPETALESGTGSNIVSILRGLLGMVVILIIAFLLSRNKRSIAWKSVGIGLILQIIIAIAVLNVPFVESIFEFIGKLFIKVYDFTRYGSEFIFGDLMDTGSYGFIFAFQVLPTIIFFSALSSVLFYYGIIQKLVTGLAWLLRKAMKLSGAESLATAGNIFLGQIESPLMIKAYLGRVNRSEMMLIMVGGMATIAGSVFAIYMGILGGDDPAEQLVFAKHLLAASVMAAPGAIVAAKILDPHTEPVKPEAEISKDRFGSNVLESIAKGTVEGVKLAVGVGATLLVFLAFIALINYVFFKIGDWTTLNNAIAELSDGRYKEFSMQFILGYALAPLTWLMGVCSEDITLVGQLLGEKIVLNELIAYKSLKGYIDVSMFTQEKSILMATYLLCGFANFGSIGIQLGGIGGLVPEKRKMISQLGVRAMIGGVIASLLSATIIGMLIG